MGVILYVVDRAEYYQASHALSSEKTAKKRRGRKKAKTPLPERENREWRKG